MRRTTRQIAPWKWLFLGIVGVGFAAITQTVPSLTGAGLVLLTIGIALLD